MTLAIQTLDETLGVFMKADARERCVTACASIRAGTVAPIDLEEAFNYNLLVPNSELAIAAIETRAVELFTCVAGRMKRGWDLVDSLYADARDYDTAVTRRRGRLVHLARHLRQNAVAFSMFEHNEGSSILRRSLWQATHVKALPNAADCPWADRCEMGQRACTLAASWIMAPFSRAPVSMARAWTKLVGMRRNGRPQHGRFYGCVEANCRTGGHECTRVAAAMIRVYVAAYPESYTAAILPSGNAMLVGWELVELTAMVGPTVMIAWGGTLHIAYNALFFYRIDWFVYAMNQLPPGPADARYREMADGVSDGVRLAAAVVALSQRSSSPFMAAVLTLVACAGYGQLALVDAMQTSVMCRNNARHLRGSTHVSDALARMAGGGSGIVSNVCFYLLASGTLSGDSAFTPALIKSGSCVALPARIAACADRMMLPVLTRSEASRVLILSMCLLRRRLPVELVRIIALFAAKNERHLSIVWHTAMQRTMLRGVVF